MFIKKIFENKIDESVHRQFVRFSKGQFENRAIINIRKTSMIKITTSFELANDLVKFISFLSSEFKIKGLLMIKEQISDLKGKKKKGFFVYDIDKKISGEELKSLVSKANYTLFDCVSEDNSIDLKIKKRLPRPGKGSKAKVNDKFCQLILSLKYWPQVQKEFLFDLPSEIKKVHFEHTYIIKDINIPKELEKEGDYEKIRLGVKRTGKIIRKAIVDGKESIKEKDFTA